MTGAWPTFVVGGTVRAGTSSLYRFLSMRRDIGMSPQKEPHFFSHSGRDLSRHGPYEDPSDMVIEPQAYRALFRQAASKPVRGECSASYLYHADRGAPLMRQLVPDLRAAFVLRDPVARAYSHYRLQRLYGWEPVDTFEEALRLEDSRIAAGWLFPFHYRSMGFYSRQVRHTLVALPANQLLFLRFEEMVRDWQTIGPRLLSFIGASAEPPLEPLPHENDSGIPRRFELSRAVFGRGRARRLAHRLIPSQWLRSKVGRAIVRANRDPTPRIPPSTAAMLAEAYYSDVIRLSEMIEINVQPWFEAWNREAGEHA